MPRAAPRRRFRPGWAACGLALLAMLTGGALVARARAIQPQREVERDGLRLRLERAVWLHEPTDHGDVAALPTSEGAPEPGERRLVVGLSLYNTRGASRAFDPRELVLSESSGKLRWTPKRGGPGSVTLRPSELLSVTLSFDVRATPEPLRLEWTRGPAPQLMLFTRRPPTVGEPLPRWPRLAETLPAGDAASGSALFHGRLACVSCHGSPSGTEAARLGPPLGDFARVGATRVAGLGAVQYAYESLLNPNAFIVSECAGHTPCARPSTMPLYGEVLSQQEMADLLRYLVGPRATE
ncbi:hypothetical protein P2318_30820 [Myxococcaceae bacterium GXIMD 01537]